MDQLSGGRTVGFGNLPMRLKVNEQRRDDGVRREPMDVRRVNDSDIDELGKSELTWGYVKNAIAQGDPLCWRPTKRIVYQGYPNKIGHGRKVVKKYRWLQERVIAEGLSEDELLG
jgi:hypothetical protein